MAPILKNFQRLMTLSLIIMFSGCSLLYELQPHRLKRLNQGDGMSSDVYYSVNDSSFKNRSFESESSKKMDLKDPLSAEVIDAELGLID